MFKISKIKRHQIPVTLFSSLALSFTTAIPSPNTTSTPKSPHSIITTHYCVSLYALHCHRNQHHGHCIVLWEIIIITVLSGTTHSVSLIVMTMTMIMVVWWWWWLYTMMTKVIRTRNQKERSNLPSDRVWQIIW